ncbi:MerR family DNA-binding transcriptional regulator [Clostridium saccharobutylicum]|nr:MerR family DNA-binding transcriptional regulator [Clostridium saccharobutylicum]AQR88764.1 MerR family regulatory protein [Clostridium saccharobutylicum]AQR98662.1 MerR family regulatory protein [Clostridium saccharobutylicum]AQS12652.1 MerR family regulatory protein [Clostridium saccharobutylicum]MBA2907820.1 DNA-binding transcriptional MerR regulator [Clostridium saccharobutylicum]MBA8792368.1 DNA-binding transcriptional MerR regulator [Clostridium saccharobutylicum]
MGENKILYQIGEVSKICNIPIKTLRYYDEIKLLI